MRRRTSDFVLIGAVLVFAFLASSFAVRNSDFWLHLASGRLLAEKRYQFGVDPFAFTTDNHYWANHAWLFDWPLYLLYSGLGEDRGGTVLVVLKALLISLLAGVLLRIRRPGSQVGWPAACTLLAVLAMHPRLLLHSTLLSYLLLALTLWLLWRPPASGGCQPPGAVPFRRQLRHYAPVLLLFVLWVNVDGWFLLGPLLAALFWLGDRLQPVRNANEGLRRTPGWLWPAGLAVCLINPHHLHAFTLPVELMPLPAALRHDARFESLHVSPWQMSLYYDPLGAVNLANSAYLVLLAIGALSFLLNIRNLAGWRLMVWLTFAGLSAWLWRTIPFFAVVAAPITALNMQEIGAKGEGRGAREEASVLASRSSLLGRLLCYFSLLLSAFVLIGLAWLGWLQGFQDNSHHVDWAVRPNSSLRRAAETLRLWQGKLGGGRGFLSHPSVVHYCAYFCPQEKGFLDQRLPLFYDVADAYEEICQALNPALASGLRSQSPRAAVRGLLRDWDITHLVLYDPVLPRLFPALQQLADEKGDWTLLDIDGQALIVGWRDGQRSLPSGVPLFDAERLAFSSESANEGESMLGEAPRQGPQREPRADSFWSHLGMGAAAPSWQAAAADVLFSYFEYRERQRQTLREFAWVAAFAGLPALSTDPLDGLLRLAVHIEQASQNEPQSPALPLLAVRAARRALAENPDDANAYLHLGRAYLGLSGRTPEGLVLGSLPPLAELRHIQIAVALENALRCHPHLPSVHEQFVHEQLAGLYYDHRFFDAALDHRRAALRLVRQTGPGRGENASDFARRLEQRETALKEFERRLGDAKYEFALRTRNLGSEPYRKAEIALKNGLAKLALEDVLMSSSGVLLGGEGVRLQVQLQLMMGRIDLLRTQLRDPEWKKNKANLGIITLGVPGQSAAPAYRLPAYDWLLLCLAAADGDYDEAASAVRLLQAEVEAEVRGLFAVWLKQLEISTNQPLKSIIAELQKKMLQIIGAEMALSAVPQPGFAQTMAHLWRLDTTSLLPFFSEAVKKQAMLQVLAGMLDLERGRPNDAKQAFRQARTLSRQAPASLPLDPANYLAETYLRLLAITPSRAGK